MDSCIPEKSPLVIHQEEFPKINHRELINLATELAIDAFVTKKLLVLPKSSRRFLEESLY